MTPSEPCYIHKSAPCSAIIKKMISPAADGSKYRDKIQSNIMQTVGKLRTLSFKWDISNKSLSQGSGNHVEEETERV